MIKTKTTLAALKAYYKAVEHAIKQVECFRSGKITSEQVLFDYWRGDTCRKLMSAADELLAVSNKRGDLAAILPTVSSIRSELQCLFTPNGSYLENFPLNTIRHALKYSVEYCKERIQKIKEKGYIDETDVFTSLW